MNPNVGQNLLCVNLLLSLMNHPERVIKLSGDSGIELERLHRILDGYPMTTQEESKLSKVISWRSD